MFDLAESESSRVVQTFHDDMPSTRLQRSTYDTAGRLVVEARRTEMVYQIWEEGETFMGILVILMIMKPRTSDDESNTP